MNGLQEEVKAELKLHLVTSLPKMMDYAQLIDENNQALGRGELNSGGKLGVAHNSHPSSRIVTHDGGSKTNASNAPVGGEGVKTKRSKDKMKRLLTIKNK